MGISKNVNCKFYKLVIKIPRRKHEMIIMRGLKHFFRRRRGEPVARGHASIKSSVSIFDFMQIMILVYLA